MKRHLKTILDSYFNETGQKRFLKSKNDFAIPILLIGNKLNLVNENDRLEKTIQVNKHIIEIFSEKPGCDINVIYLSDHNIKEGSNEFIKINKFLEACICEDLTNQFVIDASIDFDSNHKYTYYTRKKIADFNEKAKKIFHKMGTVLVGFASMLSFLVPARRVEV